MLVISRRPVNQSLCRNFGVITNRPQTRTGKKIGEKELLHYFFGGRGASGSSRSFNPMPRNRQFWLNWQKAIECEEPLSLTRLMESAALTHFSVMAFL